MALPQPKVQAPYIPGQKEPADLVDEQEPSGSNKSSGDGGREKQQGDYYTPVATKVKNKGNREGAGMNDLYSPDAGVEIATSDKKPTPQMSTSTALTLLLGQS